MSDLLRRYADLERRRREQETALRTTIAELEEMRPQVVAQMEEMGLESAKVGGFTFKLGRRYYPTIPEENRGAVVEYLRDNGWGDLVRETVHPSTLSSFVTEQMEMSGRLPDELEDLITVAEFQRVQVRKG